MNENAEYITLTHLYKVGQKLQDLEFKDAVVEALIGKFNWPMSAWDSGIPGPGIIRFTYSSEIAADSVLRKLFMEMYARKATGATLGELRRELPVSLLDSLMTALLDMRRGKTERFENGEMQEFRVVQKPRDESVKRRKVG